MTPYISPAVPYYDWKITIGDGWYGITQPTQIVDPPECVIWFGSSVTAVPVSALVFVSLVLLAVFAFMSLVIWFQRYMTPNHVAANPAVSSWLQSVRPVRPPQ